MKGKNWKAGLLLLLGFTLTALLFGCTAKEKAPVTAPEQMNNSAYIVGISQGASGERVVAKELPQAQVKYYTSSADGYLAVQQGKVAAFVYDRVAMEYAIGQGLTGVKLLPQGIGEPIPIAVGISPKSEIEGLQEKINAFLAEQKENGTLEEMYRRWITEGDETMPSFPEPENPSLTLQVGTTGVVQPFTYYKGTQLSGYDIELIYRFAQFINADVKISTYDYGGIIAAAESGAIDCIIANLNITEERKQSILFSDVIYESANVAMVQSAAAAAPAAPLETANYGVMTGSTAETYLGNTYPQATISTFPTIVDALTSLANGKVDYVMTAYTTALNGVRLQPQLEIVKNDVVMESSAIAVSKGNPDLLTQLNEVLAKLREDGSLEEMVSYWTSKDRGGDRAAPLVASGKNGVLRVAISADREPMCFVEDGEYAGLDCELIQRMVYEMDMTVEFQNMQFASLVAALASNKADVIISNMAPTQERKESVNFTDTYFDNPQVLLGKAGAPVTGGQQASPGFFEGLKASFIRTFITEDRWKMVLDGLMVTVLLSVCSGVLGGTLGFGICMLRRNKRRLASVPAAALIRIIQGTPIVVLLMILYYVIFGEVDISAIVVAILGFGVNFGVYVSEMIRTGIDAVDGGQIEAAYALGFSRMRTFWKVTFPQAARHFLPVLKGEFISMVKMTSVVGYIAVQDLTKVSDIIRSRTMEAFFPLIATAVLYFIVANLLTALLSHVEVRLDPKRRKRATKGVVRK